MTWLTSEQKDLCDPVAVQCRQADSFAAHVRLFARKKGDEKFQQNVFVIYKLEEFVYLLDVSKSVFDKVIAKSPICIATNYS